MNSGCFDLTGRTVVVTGAAGLLGLQHCRAICSYGGIAVLLDHDSKSLHAASDKLTKDGFEHLAFVVDVTDETQVLDVSRDIRSEVGEVWGLVNNVASNPSMSASELYETALEEMSIAQWNFDLTLGITSAFLCSRIFGGLMARAGGGSIVNVASDLALIAPDQRVYQAEQTSESRFVVKPVSYSVVKTAMLGLTRYLATYWSPVPVRCNALIPGSVLGSQSENLKSELCRRIPLDRLAEPSEYQGAIVFLLADSSAYMTGAGLVIDGGRTIW